MLATFEHWLADAANYKAAEQCLHTLREKLNEAESN